MNKEQKNDLKIYLFLIIAYSIFLTLGYFVGLASCGGFK